MPFMFQTLKGRSNQLYDLLNKICRLEGHLALRGWPSAFDKNLTPVTENGT